MKILANKYVNLFVIQRFNGHATSGITELQASLKYKRLCIALIYMGYSPSCFRPSWNQNNMPAPHALLYPHFRWLQWTTYLRPPIAILGVGAGMGQVLLKVFSISVESGLGWARVC